jgi:hypothetical protein
MEVIRIRDLDTESSVGMLLPSNHSMKSSKRFPHLPSVNAFDQKAEHKTKTILVTTVATSSFQI